MAIAALIIALVAAAFTGYHVYLAFKEQRLRLRPYVYVDSINQDISTVTNTIKMELVIKNCGLMIAKNARISPVLSFDGIPQKQIALEKPAKAMILPQQIVLNPMQIQGEIMKKVLQGQVSAKIDIRIDYESAGQKYFYKGTYTFFTGNFRWIFQEGNAN